MNTTTAEANVINHLAKATNNALADALEIAVTGIDPHGNLDTVGIMALRSIEHHIRNEARKRVGPAANTAADAAREAFNAKWGISEDMTEAELDAIFDSIPEEAFKTETPGEWFYLVAELRK